MHIPTVEEVDRVAGLEDPALRNRHITRCYHALSLALRERLGDAANWCTFATWASRQAGHTIRHEDLTRTAESLLARAPEVAGLLRAVAASLTSVQRSLQEERISAIIREAVRPSFARASEAVARGNRKVFEEIGREFARFYARFRDDEAPDARKLAEFVATLRPGDPPEGQGLLWEAFTAYYEACFSHDERSRAQRMLYANLLVGLHEQTRLQPEIREALDAATGDPAALRERLVKRLLPGTWRRLRYGLAHLFGRRPPLDSALDVAVTRMQGEIRRIISQSLMTLHLPQGRILRLGTDLKADFPDPLREIEHAGLTELLTRIDLTTDSVRDTGTRDWSDFPDRMHFITDLFRCYQTWPGLFNEPFEPHEALAPL